MNSTLNRKDFLKSVVGCGLLGATSASLAANDVDAPEKEKFNYAFRRYVAERYVDSTISDALVNEDGYYHVSPIGYVTTPDKSVKHVIEIPAKYRRVFTTKYNVVVREQMIAQLIEFFETKKTGTFLDRL